MPYSVSITPSARRELSRIRGKDYARIEAAIDALADDPRPAGCVKLAGDDNAWRIRVVEYRVVYEIHDKRLVVLVVRLGHRKDIYKKRK